MSDKNNKKVCADFFRKFPKYRNQDTTNEDRVAFMLAHPLIRSKLDEWIEEGKSVSSPPGPGRKKKKTNVTNQLIENGDNESIQFSPSQSQQSNDKDKHFKNPAQSAIHRESGNSLFKQRKLHESLYSYNQAIILAPFSRLNLQIGISGSLDSVENPKTSKKCMDSIDQDSQELLPLSLANRSAVYFELGEKFYEKALEDADLALKYGYPGRLRSKLLLRKANIYVKRREWVLAQNIIKQIKTEMQLQQKQNTGDEGDGDHLPPDVVSKIKELEDKMEIKMNEKDSKQGLVEQDLVDNIGIMKSTFIENEEFENASILIQTSYSDKSTRFVKATTELKKGDVIFQEQPFASVLLPQFYDSHCHHCHRMLEKKYFFPCQKCTQVKFCSEACAESSWSSYHKEECLFLDLLHSVGIAHLAVRVTLCAGIPSVLKALEKQEFLKSPKNNATIFAKGFSSYERVYSLLDHLDDMHMEDVFQYTLTASLLTNWLIKKTSWLTEMTAEDQSKIGGVVLRHICQLICNAHAITDVLCDVNLEKVSLSTSDESQLRIASAIFPAASLMNHSCDPNIAFGFVSGKTLIVKVVQDVKSGGEIFNCYGPHFRRMNRNTRQTALREQYFFNCNCKPCEDESSSTSFVDTFSSFKCDKCEGPVVPPDPETAFEDFTSTCRDCGETHDLQDSMRACMYTDRLFQDGEVLLERGNVQQALKIFQACQNQRKRILYKFHSDVGQICDLIGRCYATIGDFKDAVECVKESLAYVEKRFGSESLEYGREIKKYADLLIQVDKDKHEPEITRLVERYKCILEFY